MDEIMTDRRIPRMERRVRLLFAIVAIPTALSAYLMLRKPPAPRLPSAIGNMKLLPDGIKVWTPHGSAFWTMPGKHHAEAILKADKQGAVIGIGTETVASHQIVREGSPIIEWNAKGQVESKILIDTRTGEWTLVRARYDASRKVVKEEKRQLLPPLLD